MNVREHSFGFNIVKATNAELLERIKFARERRAEARHTPDESYWYNEMRACVKQLERRRAHGDI